MENMTEFDAGRAAGILYTLAELEEVVTEMSEGNPSQTQMAIASILTEVLNKTKEKATKKLNEIIG